MKDWIGDDNHDSCRILEFDLQLGLSSRDLVGVGNTLYSIFLPSHREQLQK